MVHKSDLCTLGGVIFEVQGDAVNTMHQHNIQNFSEFKETRTVNYAKTKLVGRTARVSFTGREPYEISMKLRWSLLLNPFENDTLRLLRRYTDEGTVIPFYMGGKKHLGADWVITSLDISNGRFNPAGVMFEADVAVKLTEYV